MRERSSSEADWFPVEFLIYYYDHDKLRAFGRKTAATCLKASTTWWMNSGNAAGCGKTGTASGR